MKCDFIATWKMAQQGVEIAADSLKNSKKIEEAIEMAICNVENNPNYASVGYGGLPNINGEVELDAAYMNGSTMEFGAVSAVKNIKNPIKVAIKLSKQKRNIFLTSKGAEKYAEENGFEFNNMLTQSSKNKWIEKSLMEFDKEKIEAYGGHDTVCMIGKDHDNNMAVGVSTSGLFMKKAGRVGDSPVIGSGFYCIDSIGGAAATGVGEDIMKGCLSYEIIREMSEGSHPQVACEKVLKKHVQNFKKIGHESGSMSVIALGKSGNYGASTTKKEFPFVISTEHGVEILVAQNTEGNLNIFKPDSNWINNYTGD